MGSQFTACYGTQLDKASRFFVDDSVISCWAFGVSLSKQGVKHYDSIFLWTLVMDMKWVIRRRYLMMMSSGQYKYFILL